MMIEKQKSRKAEVRFEAKQSLRSAASQTFPVHLVGCAHLSTFALVGRVVHLLLCATMCTHAGPNPDLFPPRYAPLCQPVLIYLAVNILRARLYVANRGWSMQVSPEPGFASFTIANTGTVQVQFRGERIIQYSNSWDRIVIFVFVFGRYFLSEYYLYSYSEYFSKLNIFVFVFTWFFKPK